MAYKPPKLQTDGRGRNFVQKVIKGQVFKRYLGKAGTPEAKREHDRFLEEYRTGTVNWSKSRPGRQAPTRPVVATTTPVAPGEIGPQYPVAEAVEIYWASERLRDVSYSEHQCTRDVLDTLVELWGPLPVDRIDTDLLFDLRVYFRTNRKWNFKKIKDAERRVRLFVSFCCLKKLCSDLTGANVDRMPTFQAGELGTTVAESRDPVELEALQAALPFFCETFQDIVRVQFLCGMRPNEVVRLRGLASTGNPEYAGGDRPVWNYFPDNDCWTYRFDDHKNRRKTRKPLIKAIPRAAFNLLARHLKREQDDHGGDGWLFRPSVCKAERAAKRPPRTSRVNKRNRAQRERMEARAAAETHEDDWFKVNKYGSPANYINQVKRVVARCVDAGELSATWTANQLRHGIGTYLAQVDGIESAATYLGHANSSTTRKFYAQVTDPEILRVAAVVQNSPVAKLSVITGT